MVSRKSLAKILVFAVLQLGALAGVPVTPQQIEEIMNATQRTKIEYVVKKDDPPTP